MRPLEDLCYVEGRVGGSFKRIYADAWKNEKISATATITEAAVETGAKVNDHYLPDQLAASASLFISGSPIRGDLDPDFKGERKTFPFKKPDYPNNTPLLSSGGLLNAAGAGIAAGLSALGVKGDPGPLPESVTVLAFSQNPVGRLRKVLEQLLDWRQKGELVNVGFSQCRVENLALASITLARTGDDGDSGTIDLEFKQLNFVSTQSAAAVSIPVEPRAKPKGDSSTVSAADATRNQKSLAAAGFDSARSGLGL